MMMELNTPAYELSKSPPKSLPKRNKVFAVSRVKLLKSDPSILALVGAS